MMKYDGIVKLLRLRLSLGTRGLYPDISPVRPENPNQLHFFTFDQA